MNIGYVKFEKLNKKLKNKWLKNLCGRLKYKIHNLTNKVWQDKYNSSVFYINNYNEKSIDKLKILLSKNNIEYVITEDNVSVNYPTLNGNRVMKYVFPEIVENLLKKIKPKTEQISICTNTYSDENIKLIEELAQTIKVLNIVTENEWFDQLEKKLEGKEIYITVTNNKRKALKNTTILINLDYEKLDEFNINRNMIIIDLTEKLIIPKSFEGIVIKRIEIDTKKVMRVFEDFEHFDKSKLIEAEVLKQSNYENARSIIKNSRINVLKYKNKKVIKDIEFNRIRRIYESEKKISSNKQE